MNAFLESLIQEDNQKITENGAKAYKSTLSKVYDLFAFGGAYRNRTDADVQYLFLSAFAENKELALKCLFYLRDVRGGAGERRFFRQAYRALVNADKKLALKNLSLIPEYGRWDDILHITYDTSLYQEALDIFAKQLKKDVDAEFPSIAAKWAPSLTTANKRMAKDLAKHMGLTQKEYRKMLVALREKMKVLEVLMCGQRYEEIDFTKIPSQAGLRYSNAFLCNVSLRDRYIETISNENKKVNAKTLYPYQIEEKIHHGMSEHDKAVVRKYWKNLPDYTKGKEGSVMCMIDTSGSMIGNPIHVARSLGIYTAARLRGPFHNTLLTFSSKPQLVTLPSDDIVVNSLYLRKYNIVENTDLIAAFELLKKAALKSKESAENMPETLLVISDMEIDLGADLFERGKKHGLSEMERYKRTWDEVGLKMPHVVYWNVNARQDTILEISNDVTCVSGLSPILLEQVLSGGKGIELMLEKLLSNRYKNIMI